jgi:hypothetical protein
MKPCERPYRLGESREELGCGERSQEPEIAPRGHRIGGTGARIGRTNRGERGIDEGIGVYDSALVLR